MTLTPLEVVQAAILGTATRLDVHDVDLDDALGLVLAVDVTADQPVPPFANTAMDGYAVQAADTTDASPAAPTPCPRAGPPTGRSAPGRRSAS